MPEEPTIILLNRALPFNCVGKLTGWSGVEYATSTYEESQGGQVCRLPLSRWREIKQDVTTGFARRACQWEVDVEAKDEPSGAIRAERDRLPEAARRESMEMDGKSPAAGSPQGPSGGEERRGRRKFINPSRP